MAKTKGQKTAMLNSLREKFIQAKAVVFAGYNALPVKLNEELRQSVRKNGGEYVVAKKTLLNIAVRESDLPDFDAKGFSGQVATIFGFEDEVTPAKAVNEFIKKNEGKMSFLGGILEKKLLSSDEVKQLSQLPTKEELLAKIVGSLNAPVSGFVNVLAGNLRGLVRVLAAIKDQKA